MTSNPDAVLTVGVFEKILATAFQQQALDIKRDIRDEMHSQLTRTKIEIISEITDFINSAILPQIDDLQTNMATVKIHLKLA